MIVPVKKIMLVLVAGVIFLSACQKKAENNPLPTPASPIGLSPAGQTIKAQTDTVADGGVLKIKLQLDSAAIDETVVSFQHSASADYSKLLDAPYFPGFGQGSLCSLTRDGVGCAVQILPFSPGRAIPLKVTTRSDGSYLLKTSFSKNLPSNMGIWLKDAFRKDSLNIRLANYHFDVAKSDTNTFGAHRFSIVVR